VLLFNYLNSFYILQQNILAFKDFKSYEKNACDLTENDIKHACDPNNTVKENISIIRLSCDAYHSKGILNKPKWWHYAANA
jgi:hypothetical protein